MERFLITLSLGPVQSLIGAARRTRDLWCGSWLLSEAARAAAHALHTRQPSCLIFPYLNNPNEDLKPQNHPGDAANIVNILRAEVEVCDAEAAREYCEQAKAAAISRLEKLGEEVRKELKKMKRPVRDEVWQAQIDDILEGFAAWVPVETAGYAQANEQIGGVLAARKVTRDFRVCKPLITQGLPKSSLDGALETVLQGWPEGDRARRKLRLSAGEQLDALGVIKRLAGRSDQFTAYSRIAADSWIGQLTSAQQRGLRDYYEPLVSMDLATRVSGNKGIYDALPYDAQMLYKFRLEKALSQEGLDEKDRKALKNVQECIKQISQEKNADGRPMGNPVPYAAILKADGDRMGVLFSKADSADRARKISRKLHEFASKVRQIVRCHRGHAIYAGGDDVLALVPLAQALNCSRALAEFFKEALDGIAEDMGICSAERPTLSVGLGIGHLMEPLGSLRARADRAEHAAKGDDTDTPRNALAIALGIRSGAELSWRAQWSDERAFDALSQFTVAYHQDLLPTRAAYDLRDIDQRLAWLRDDNSEIARGMRAAEVNRMLERARSEGGSKSISDDLKELITARAENEPLKNLAETLIIARWLSARTENDLGERK